MLSRIMIAAGVVCLIYALCVALHVFAGPLALLLVGGVCLLVGGAIMEGRV